MNLKLIAGLTSIVAVTMAPLTVATPWNSCASGWQPGSGDPVTMLSIVRTFTSIVSASSDCAGGAQISSDVPDACPVPGAAADLAMQGVYCSPNVAAGRTIACTWARAGVTPATTKMYVGWDLNNDGRLGGNNAIGIESAAGPLAENTYYTFSNNDADHPNNTGAHMLIAYPATSLSSYSSTDATTIGCKIL